VRRRGGVKRELQFGIEVIGAGAGSLKFGVEKRASVGSRAHTVPSVTNSAFLRRK
jgi:hypothetical protein